MTHKEVFRGPFSMDEPGCYIFCNEGRQMCYTVIIDWETREDILKLRRIVDLMNGKEGVEPFKFVGYNFENDLIGVGETEEEAKKPILLTRGWGYLTGRGALALDPKIARDIQIKFMQWTISKLKGKAIEFKDMEENQ